MDRILVIVAHPDDEVLGMGGTIAKLSSQGKKVHLLIVTDGSTCQYQGSENLEEVLQSKQKETDEAARILGIQSVTYGMLPDMRLDTIPHVAVNKVIENAIESIRPDTVFTHFWGDVNLDHQCVYRSTMVAVRPVATQCVKEVYCYNVPSSTEWSPAIAPTVFMPNYYVDISEHSAVKYSAMEAYTTELREYPHPRSIAYLKKDDELTGLKVGIGCAEAFVLLRKLG